MTEKILTGAALRDWDTPEMKAVTLRRARQAWIDKNRRIADNFARKAGLLK